MDEKRIEDETEWLTGTIPLNIAGEDVAIEVEAPAGQTKPRRLLPVFQKITNTIVDIAEKQLLEKGKTISCKAGCGACCRQLVPIAEMETFHLRDLVEEMPEPRQSEIKRRFNEALEKLYKAGLLEKLRNPFEISREERKSLGNDYFRLQIACPFLEEESCSIHQMRPLACREYLVTSPAENCARPQDNIEGVDLPAKVSVAVYSLDSVQPANFYKWTPLIIALEWAETHMEDSQTLTSPEWVDKVLAGITKA